MKQLVIKSTESDLHDFYVNTLGGEITNNYVLLEKEAVLKYNIPMDLHVYELKFQNLKLFVLIYGISEEDEISHIRINLDDVEEIYSRAEQNHFRTFHNINGSLESFYIEDHNHNLFDFKHNLDKEKVPVSAQ